MKRWLLVLLFGVMAAGLIAVWLLRRPGHVVLQISPTTATITIDGQPATGNHLTVEAGQHTLTASAAQYISSTIPFHLIGSQTLTITIDLKRLPTPVQLLDQPVQKPVISQDQKWLIFARSDGKLLERLATAGDADNHRLLEPLSAEFALALSDFQLSPSEDRALLDYSSQSSLLNLNRFDLVHQQETKLDPSIEQPRFSPSGKQIAYILNKAHEPLRLIVTDDQLKTITKTIDLRSVGNVQTLAWGETESVLYVLSGDHKVFQVDLFRQTVQAVAGLETVQALLVSPNHQWLVAEQTIGAALLNLTSQQLSQMTDQIDLTKAAFSRDGQWLVFATPQLNQTDQLFAVSATGQRHTLAYSDSNTVYHLSNLAVDSNLDQLFFVGDGKLFEVKPEARD